MKLSYNIMAALAIALGACSQENIVETGYEGIDGDNILTAIAPQGKSRLDIGAIEGGKASLSWSVKDAFVAFNSNKESAEYALVTGEGTDKGQFAASKKVEGLTSAIFPKTISPVFGEDNISVSLPLVYVVADNSQNLPMWGSIEGQSVSFSHLTSMMRIELANLPAEYTSIRITADSPIAGEFVLNAEKTALVPAVGNTDAANKSVTVKLKENSVHAYIPLPAGHYAIAVSALTDSQHELAVCSFDARDIVCGNMINVRRETNAPVADVNLAKGMTATASSNPAGASNAVYGDVAFPWQAAGNTDEWFQVEMTAPVIINHVVLKWDAGAYASQCEIQTSVDGKKYTTVYAISKWDATATAGVMVLPFGKDVVAKYVKAVLKNGATSYNMTIKEFEIYNSTKDMNIYPLNKNVALNKYVTVTSEFYPANQLIDGREDLAWASSDNSDQVITIDMGTVHEINTVDFSWVVANYAKDAEILTSMDGTTYTSIHKSEGWAPTATAGAEKQTVSFATTKTRYIQIKLVSGTLWQMICNEMAVYKK